MKLSEEVWNDIRAGLPKTPSDGMRVVPIPEILRVIEYCLDASIEDFDTAFALAKRVRDTNPDIRVKNWFASVCFDAKKWQAAYEASVELVRDVPNANTHFNASKAAYSAGRVQEAIGLVKKSLELDPMQENRRIDLSVFVASTGKFDESYKILREIDKEKLNTRDKNVLEFNKAWYCLYEGKFKEGMALLHLGRQINVWGSISRKFPKPQWDGVTREGKTILIAGEGGLGDEIINARFGKIIKARGMHTVMSTVHKAGAVLSRVEGIDKVIDDSELSKFFDYDYWTPCMDLPYTLGIDEYEIPNEPYISALLEYVEKWSKIIPKTGKLRVGVRWMGNKLYELDLHRTLPVAELEKLALIPNVELYSLQRDDGVEMLPQGSPIVPLHDKLTTLDDTLAAIANLDLVITSCTSIGHMAGALGKPVWICPPMLPYYVWAKKGDKSAWYPSVTLFRQTEWGEWDSVFKRIREDLVKFK